MKKVIVGIGIPGSGKTPVLKSFAEKNAYVYVCPDDIREELTGSAADQSRSREVWTEAYKRLQAQLMNGETVVFDATMANPDQRKQFLDFARKNGAERIEGIVFDTPLETATERNEQRDRKVPHDVMERMDNWIRTMPPEIGEGLDAIFTVDEEQKLKEVKVRGEDSVITKEFQRPH